MRWRPPGSSPDRGTNSGPDDEQAPANAEVQEVCEKENTPIGSEPGDVPAGQPDSDEHHSSEGVYANVLSRKPDHVADSEDDTKPTPNTPSVSPVAAPKGGGPTSGKSPGSNRIGIQHRTGVSSRVDGDIASDGSIKPVTGQGLRIPAPEEDSCQSASNASRRGSMRDVSANPDRKFDTGAVCKKCGQAGRWWRDSPYLDDGDKQSASGGSEDSTATSQDSPVDSFAIIPEGRR